MGRRRKPDYLRALEGDQKAQGRSDDLARTAGPLGDPPERMTDPVAVECWREVRETVPWLIKWDRLVVEMFCETYSDWRQAGAIIDRDGLIIEVVRVKRFLVSGERRKVTRKAHPLLTAYQSLRKQLFWIACQLGMTPLTRQYLNLASERPQQSALAEFIRAGGR